MRNFSIIQAVKAGFINSAESSGYLLKIALLPLLAEVVTNYLLMAQIEKNGLENIRFVESALYNLPAIALTGWFVFAQVRYMLLGEDATKLPTDKKKRRNFFDLMQISVILFILFKMGIYGMMALTFRAMEMGNMQDSIGIQMMSVITFAMMIWFMRFYCIPIVAAADLPLKQYLQKTDGFGFSFKVIGLLLLCAIPVMFAAMGPISAIIGDTPLDELSTAQIMGNQAMNSLAVLVFTAVSTAAILDMLRQMFKNEKTG